MDVLEAYSTTLAGAVARVARVGPAHLELPTPCAQWSVAQLLTHIAATTITYTAIVTDTPPSEGSGASDPPDGAGFEELAERARAAWSIPGALEREYAYRFLGAAPGHRILGIHVADLLLHSWDLARATGQDDTIDADCARFALAVHQREFTDERRDQYFGAATAVPCDAGPQRVLLARSGRDHRWLPSRVPIDS